LRQTLIIIIIIIIIIKMTPEQATKAQSGSRGIAVFFFNLGARWGGWSTPRSGCFTLGKDPVLIV
jgi:hypothetical protein